MDSPSYRGISSGKQILKYIFARRRNPTSAECKASSVGLALGIVWDTTDSRTQWSPASLVATITTGSMVATSIASDRIHKNNKKAVG